MNLVRVSAALLAACLAVPAVCAQEKDSAPSKEAKKQSLPSHKVHRWPGGTYVTFDGWVIGPGPTAPGWLIRDTAPKGRHAEFTLRLAVGTPDEADLKKLFELGPAVVQRWFPYLKRQGEQQKCKFGGDEARLERYEGVRPADRKKVLAQVIYLRKGDVAVGVVGLGTEAGFVEFGRAIEVVAQSISFKASPIEKALAGTWKWSTTSSVRTGSGDSGDLAMSSARTLTIFASGAFTMTTSGTGIGSNVRGTFSYLKDGACRGKVIKRGDVLTFHADNGKRWSGTYRLKGSNGLALAGQVYSRE
jgi:hypothetical protein